MSYWTMTVLQLVHVQTTLSVMVNTESTLEGRAVSDIIFAARRTLIPSIPESEEVRKKC